MLDIITPEEVEAAAQLFAAPSISDVKSAVPKLRDRRREDETSLSKVEELAWWADVRACGYAVRASLPLPDIRQAVWLGLWRAAIEGVDYRTYVNIELRTLSMESAPRSIPQRTLTRFYRAYNRSLKLGRHLTDEELKEIGLRRHTFTRLLTERTTSDVGLFV